MPTEIEAKFLHVDIEDVRANLQKNGAQLIHPMRLMRRELFDYPDRRYKNNGNHELLRIRDEGDKITITYKKSIQNANYRREIETSVGSYDDIKELLLAIDLKITSYQESKRETWHLDEVEVVIDEWPWLNPYIEIEGPSEEAIKAAAAKLGYDWEDAKFGSVDTAYKAQYSNMQGHDSIGEVAEVKFNSRLPKYLKDRI